jgi:cystathionine beta-lyase
MKYETLLTHGHKFPDVAYEAATLPVYLNSSYRAPKPDEAPKFGSAWSSNPTIDYLEEFLAELEDGRFGFAFSSGMTATAAAFSVLSPGDKVIATQDVYGSAKGGTLGLLRNYLIPFGFQFEFVDTGDPGNLEPHFGENTHAVYLETPSNPLLGISDIAAISEIAHAHGAITIVDNTFLSPYLQRPLSLGADVVVESATKFLAGHNDVIAGAVAVKSDELAEKIRLFQRLFGGILQPMEAFLIVRGLKTLSVRLDRQIENAQKVIAFLERSSRIGRLYYPGLPGHPGYEINRRQAKAAGSMLAFETTPEINPRAFLAALSVISHATSLGGVDSIIQHPASSSHASYTPERREKAGVTERLFRLSVGIEHASDLISDLEQALAKAEA